MSFNAGDGKGDGNYKTISVEICENIDPDIAVHNGAILNAALQITFPDLRIFKHQDWSGKYCPRYILSCPTGWEGFLADIENIKDTSNRESRDMVQEMYRPSWTKAVEAGIEDGLYPNENVTSAKLMTYFDKMGLLD